MIGVNALVIIILIGCCALIYLKNKSAASHKQLDDGPIREMQPVALEGGARYTKRTARTHYSNRTTIFDVINRNPNNCGNSI